MKFQIKCDTKKIGKYMSFTIRQPKKKDIKPGLPLVFIDSGLFQNNPLTQIS